MARPVLRTALCDLLGIEYPFVLAGMGPVAGGIVGPVATAELAAAVSNGGGLGVLGGSGYGPERLREEIEKIRGLTDKPFGVDLLLPANYMGEAAKKPPPADPRDLVPAEVSDGLKAILADLDVPWLEAPPVETETRPTLQGRGGGMSDAQMEVVIEEKVPVFAAGLGSPAPWIDRLHANGTVVLSLVGNVKNAERVAHAGVDAVVTQGTEAGGHTGRIGTLPLVTQAIEAIDPVPVIAAGGIGSGRGMAAMLAAGAAGVWVGTAFLVSEEANQPPAQLKRILAATEEDTKITRLYSGKTMRNIRNPLIDAWENSGIRALPMGIQGIVIRDVAHSLRQAGREDLLMNAAGQIAGMLNEVRPASTIMEEIIGETVEILSDRLPATVTARVEA
ncbi:MAG: nitronate monooxygenase family protein [Chloroflexota bacterium]|nr:nitronate monooxygenase family protein [Chloroflexota bacterium]